MLSFVHLAFEYSLLWAIFPPRPHPSLHIRFLEGSCNYDDLLVRRKRENLTE